MHTTPSIFPEVNCYRLRDAFFLLTHYPLLPKGQLMKRVRSGFEMPASSFFHVRFPESFLPVTTLKSLTLLALIQQREGWGERQEGKPGALTSQRISQLEQMSETEECASDQKGRNWNELWGWQREVMGEQSQKEECWYINYVFLFSGFRMLWPLKLYSSGTGAPSRTTNS